MKSIVASAARSALYGSGALDLWDRFKSVDYVTVVMFHRVLQPDDARWHGADPEWTISSQLFEASLNFMRKHYSVVALDDLLAAQEGPRLPTRPLLITLDDGWADNADYAAAILTQLGLPAVLFVVADAIDRREAFWQERLFAAWQLKRIQLSTVRECARSLDIALTGAAAKGESAQALRAIIASLEMLESAFRERLLAALSALTELSETPNQMISTKQLRALARGGVAIGSHGETHQPLTLVDARSELAAARRRIGEALADPTYPGLATLSFPHGRYNGDVVTAARNSGIRLMFTSDAVLTPLAADGRLSGDLLGRLHIPTHAITDSSGKFAAGRLAGWLRARSTVALKSEIDFG
jgi:peptidoglycan/xylan/chitin deacetylase (PgdA/CDA1 family)